MISVDQKANKFIKKFYDEPLKSIRYKLRSIEHVMMMMKMGSQNLIITPFKEPLKRGNN